MAVDRRKAMGDVVAAVAASAASAASNSLALAANWRRPAAPSTLPGNRPVAAAPVQTVAIRMASVVATAAASTAAAADLDKVEDIPSGGTVQACLEVVPVTPKEVIFV